MFKSEFPTTNPIPPKTFSPTQIDDISYISLEERIQSFFSGSFIPDSDSDISEYDQEAGDWSDPDPKGFDPTNDISFDELDALQRTKEISESISASKDKLISEIAVESDKLTKAEQLARSKAEAEKAEALENLLKNSIGQE